MIFSVVVKSSRTFVCSSSNLAHARPRQYNIQITRSNNNMWPRAGVHLLAGLFSRSAWAMDWYGSAWWSWGWRWCSLLVSRDLGSNLPRNYWHWSWLIVPQLGLTQAGGGAGHSSYESYVYFYQQRHFWFHVMLSLITFSVQNHTISAQIYLPI